MFANRKDAGERLAERLTEYVSRGALICAIPRGGVPVAYEIARAFDSPLDIIMVRKVGHPDSPEFAIGAVDEHGEFLGGDAAAAVDHPALQRAIERATHEAARRAALYREARQERSARGKVAVLVDDGIATGFTMRLALRILRSEEPQKIVVAVPVASEETIATLRADGADEVVALEIDQTLSAISTHYLSFDQVGDTDVISYLEEADLKHRGRHEWQREFPGETADTA